MKEYKKGDKAWIVLGMCDDALLAVEVTIVEVEDYFRKLHPDDGLLYYWVDEPIGHGLDADELMAKEEAIEELKDRYYNCIEYGERIFLDADLDTNREKLISFIKGTWPKDRPFDDDLESLYNPKERGKEWLNLLDIGVAKGEPNASLEE